MLGLWQDAASGVRVVRLTEVEEVETLICLFEGIAAAEGWHPEGELRHWQDRSVYFAVELRGQVAGGVQLVLPDRSATLPCQALWPELSLGAARGCAHVAILALDQAFRGHAHLFWSLVVELWRSCVGLGIATLYLEVTPRVLPLYRRLGWPLQIEGERRLHLGEECYLFSLGVPEVAEALLRRAEHSPYYRQIVAQAFRVTLAVREPEPQDLRAPVPLIAEA